MLVLNLTIEIQCEGNNESKLNFKFYPIEKLEALIQFLKNLESDIGYLSFKVNFEVYDYLEGVSSEKE